MAICGRCGRESADDARFCASCGEQLAVGELREERKVVSVLFADLVGSTSRAAELDPEDVRALLRRYYADLRAELERFGGTVEKFIGDAVVALFGAPRAHEDDPERAVRAALAIRDRVAAATDADPARELHVRVAVCTGEALIAVEARTSEGEATAAGDVMNTAARLQAAAPVDGVLVDDATFLATARAIVYRDHAAVAAKGKTDPVSVHEAVEPRSRFGVDLGGEGRAPLVGRTAERGLIVSALARARAEREPQLVTLVGVPGIGKSRLVRELWHVVDDDPELIFWRQGRCLSYGDGVAYWALTEIVKAQAGILESDNAEAAAAKLAAAVRDTCEDGSEARWIERHLSPLVGLAGEGDGSGERGEAYAAWRRFFEGLAERSPLVLVFEDLHWADDGLLDFIDQLPERIAGVPLLVVCTARPELLERRPGWGGGKRNALTASLRALSDTETAQLVASLLGTPVLDAGLQEVLLARAGGNPLYAEEYVRMVAGGDTSSLALPATIQGIVAARIDLLPPVEKSLLQDASALGKVFWTDGLAALAGTTARELDDRLFALERKEFVRREGRAAAGSVRRYAFVHVLVRDVAYGQLPRTERLSRHLRAAAWIESLPSDRAEDRSELLAHHYVQALDYGKAAGVDVAAVAQGAAQALRDAGDREWSLGALEHALKYYSASLPHVTAAERPYHLLRVGRARAAVAEQGIEELEEALAGLLQLGDAAAAAGAGVELAKAEWGRGEKERAVTHLEQATQIVAAEDVDLRARAAVVNERTRYLMLAGRGVTAVELADEGIALAETLGDVRLLGAAFDNRGVARVSLGDLRGVADVERAIELARGIDWSETIRASSNLGSILYALGDVGRAETVHVEALALADHVEDSLGQRWISTELALDRLVTGQWDDALRRADAMIDSCRDQPHYMETAAWRVRAWITYARGAADGLPAIRRALELARPLADPQAVYPILGSAARLHELAGQSEAAVAYADELVALIREQAASDVPSTWAFDLAIVLTSVGRAAEYLDLADALGLRTRWLEAGVAYASGDLTQAAGVLNGIPALPDEAQVRVAHAAELGGTGQRLEAEAVLAPALAIYRESGATGLLAGAESLLSATG